MHTAPSAPATAAYGAGILDVGVAARCEDPGHPRAEAAADLLEKLAALTPAPASTSSAITACSPRTPGGGAASSPGRLASPSSPRRAQGKPRPLRRRPDPATLALDRRRKGSLYTRAEVHDYWILNLVDRVLEVYREPERAASARHGWKYRNVRLPKAGASVSPLAAPSARIRVADLLP